MPHDAEEGYLEFGLFAAIRDFRDKFGTEQLADSLSAVLSEIGLKVETK